MDFSKDAGGGDLYQRRKILVITQGLVSLSSSLHENVEFLCIEK